MAKLIALYNTPTDPAAFEAYYRATHVPLALKVPGLRGVEISSGPVMTPGGPAPYYKLGILDFASMGDLQAALASPEGQKTAADLANFASGGVTLLIFDTEPG